MLLVHVLYVKSLSAVLCPTALLYLFIGCSSLGFRVYCASLEHHIDVVLKVL